MVGWQLLRVDTLTEGRTKICILNVICCIVEDLKSEVLRDAVADVDVHGGKDGVFVWVIGTEHRYAAKGVSNEMLLPGRMNDVEVIVDKLLTKTLESGVANVNDVLGEDAKEWLVVSHDHELGRAPLDFLYP